MQCNDCLARHGKKGKCPKINDCMLCLETCESHIHSHIRKDCEVIKTFIEEKKYSFPKGPEKAGPRMPILDPQRSNTVLGKMALAASKKKRDRPKDEKIKDGLLQPRETKSGRMGRLSERMPRS